MWPGQRAQEAEVRGAEAAHGAVGAATEDDAVGQRQGLGGARLHGTTEGR